MSEFNLINSEKNIEIILKFKSQWIKIFSYVHDVEHVIDISMGINNFKFDLQTRN